jgi:uncharacterized protein YqjF (DUF2071 family)
MSLEPIRRAAGPLASRAVISQHWGDLAFAHWRVDPALVAPLLLKGTRPDVFDGSAWVGLIPFELSRSAFPPLPAVPYFGRFAETNVRLYSVGEDGRRGVVFRSLEAAKLLPVLAARVGLGLPYMWSSMSIVRGGGVITYRSTRRWPGGLRSAAQPRSLLALRPLPERVVDDPLADFLTARWGMHVSRPWPSAGPTRYWSNAHESWPLQRAELVDLDDELVDWAGLPGVTDRAPDSLLYSRGVSTRFALPS